MFKDVVGLLNDLNIKRRDDERRLFIVFSNLSLIKTVPFHSKNKQPVISIGYSVNMKET